ncbi:hypothetical protein [Desulfurella sp.]|uniref:hypothetical protein n=1 Tax=Desulfurella sp. TaxID=1962857 RepID=UPI0025C6E909|nr:hypothetical protein [Desulfurella sp.]
MQKYDTNRSKRGRKPISMRRSTDQIKEYIINYVNEKQIATSNDIINRMKDKFHIANSTAYNEWKKFKDKEIVKATEDDFKKFGKNIKRKKNTKHWKTLQNSNARDEFNIVIDKIKESSDLSEVSALIDLLTTKKLRDFSIGRNIDDIDRLIEILKDFLPNGKFNKLFGESNTGDCVFEIIEFMFHIAENNREIFSDKSEPIEKILEKFKLNFLDIDSVHDKGMKGMTNLVLFLHKINKVNLSTLFLDLFKLNMIREDGNTDKILNTIEILRRFMDGLRRAGLFDKMECNAFKAVLFISMEKFKELSELNLVNTYKFSLSTDEIKRIKDNRKKINKDGKDEEFLTMVSKLKFYFEGC